uniref:Methyltransferase domain-containing protein n=1 Tax=Chromera velia CCMP2878 TaxID=1169474 RepID=A0A0G4I0Q1_9ALVE|eukprot:Cvel_9997.t1-p1 / transcript=Cvel_9997.t1 / gene=Cvel_9997 / organism=Chromera_velia_CCMP2878 / gene_product=Probable thiol methyltransferase 2, putative / transcript_product=Probable thiol methyltransferase 2, putative / location=Cvel_scaffold592:28835-31984(+) / protein_length=183 / sequence_SO=supercontig / SO=protein_coding / is_pseudo=false
MWSAGINPGQAFDAMQPVPILSKMVKEGAVPEGRALVPGCGRAYDVQLLASPARFVLGVDIAPTAVAQAQAYLDTCDPPPCRNFELMAADFFSLGESEEKKFDFIFDYTFLCALPPELNAQRAKKMSSLLKPGGVLMTLIFPICQKEKAKLEDLSPEDSHPDRGGGEGSMFGASSGIGLWVKE